MSQIGSFATKDELETALNLWINNETSARETYGEINTWNVSQITNMDNLFFDKKNFNQDISNWNVHNVTSMNGMFNTSSFNQPLNNWNVHNVTSTYLMFQGSSFNQDISNWNVNNVKDMALMFMNSSFNNLLDNWNVHNVTSTYGMFYNTNCNQPLNNWNVNNVKDMGLMFANASFNNLLDNWNVHNVTSTYGMFYNTNFNQPLNNWNVHNVKDMEAMFQDSSFNNSSIKNWNVHNVTNMNSIFNNSSLDPKYKYPIANSWIDALSTNTYNELTNSFDTLNETNIIGFFGGINNDKYVIWNVHPDDVSFNQLYIDISNSKYTFLDNSSVPQNGYTMFDGTDLSYIASVVQNFVNIGMIPPSQSQSSNKIGFIGNNSLSFFDTSNLSTYDWEDISRNPLLNISANESSLNTNFFFILNNTKLFLNAQDILYNFEIDSSNNIITLEGSSSPDTSFNYFIDNSLSNGVLKTINGQDISSGLVYLNSNKLLYSPIVTSDISFSFIYGIYYQDVSGIDDEFFGYKILSNLARVQISNKPEPEQPINNVNICFPRDTPVVTDQGEIMIQNINKTNTLNGKKVVAITESIPLDEMIVVIEKDALFKNMPSQPTKISLNHRVLFKGEMVKACELVDKVDGAYFEKYNKEILYNVLLDTYEKMIVNNLICETLHPENLIALIYKQKNKISKKKYNKLISRINKYIKNDDVNGFIKLGKRVLAM